MDRRELSKLLLATTAGAPAPGHPEPDASSPWEALNRTLYVRVPPGRYPVRQKLQTTLQNTIIGESRQSSVLLPAHFADYVLEIGNGKPGPNAGTIQRLRFYGVQGNLGCLHMNTLSHMWRLEELLFSGGPCPALVVDNCWDSNYSDIDVLGHIGPPGDPARGASVIFRNGCNNIYCRGLRIEGALSGGLYIDGSPIYVVTGKIDDGFGTPQTAPAITITADGFLVVDDFYLGGMRDQFHIDIAGSVRLGNVLLDGGTNRPAAINDRRAWRHLNAQTFPHAAETFFGPYLPLLDLGTAQFRRSHASVGTVTPAAIYSRIHPLRQVENLTTLANGSAADNTIRVSTTLRRPHGDLFKNSFLVHNATGTAARPIAGARRRILRSFNDGTLLLQGSQPVILDGDWSVEYCASHCTPLRHRNAVLDRDQSLFARVAQSLTISGPLIYVSAPGDPAYGTTKLRLQGADLSHGQDLRGLYLTDNATGEPFYIQYGLDSRDAIGVIYDRRGALRSEHTFSVVAGYAADVEVRGDVATWHFAGKQHRAALRELSEAGYEPEQAPLWDFLWPEQGSSLERIAVTTSSVLIDLSRGSEFELTVANAADFLILNPSAELVPAGQRLTITIRNISATALGTVTWDNAYRLAPWLSPASARSRSIEFRFDGHRWIEIARTPADVPD